MQLGARLIGLRNDITVLLTLAEGIAPPRRKKEGILWIAAPANARQPAARFLDHFRPDVGVWTSGDLIPILVAAAGEANIPLLMVDALEDGLPKKGLARLRQPTASALRLFERILAADENAAARLNRLGLPKEMIEVAGPLREGGAALPFNKMALEEISDCVGTRPTWFATQVQTEEVTTILRAHKNAVRFAQRLLLIIAPDDPEQAAAFAERAGNENLRSLIWSDGALPDEQTEVIIADVPGDIGLWFRLASVSFMGSSLVAGTGGSDPFEAAALGSAILYGPNCGRHLPAYSKLAEVGAARMVRDTESLTSALNVLSGPDAAANMALAAWQVVTEGAQVSDKVTDFVLDTLDYRELS